MNNRETNNTKRITENKENEKECLIRMIFLIHRKSKINKT